ncbi:prepilin-type N-terminal cleavage/methylation domain-containing protein [Aquabacterium sp.]|uniref:prepilin-type N-terminal cleavage/methylation domain-containing protein n=1 Tax=Aquabacterium sp. TaxID=1872578 RepID=UPI0035B0320F
MPRADRLADSRQRSDSGLTLLELLISVALLGILLALAVPGYSQYRNRVRSAQAASDIGALTNSIDQYYADHHQLPGALSDLPSAPTADPWGQPYVYYNVSDNGKGGARKDKALNPINSDYDLYSKGPDGVSKPQISQKDSLDDIIRASNGRFIGVAADF